MRDKREKTVLPPRLHLEKPAHCDTHGRGRRFPELQAGGRAAMGPARFGALGTPRLPEAKVRHRGQLRRTPRGWGAPKTTTHTHKTESSSWNPGRLCNPFEPKRWRAPGFGASRSRAARYQLAPRRPRPSGAPGAAVRSGTASPTRPVGAAAGARAGPRVLAGGPVTFCPQVPPGCGRWSGARRSAL